MTLETEERGELERRLALVKVGAWQAMCCHLDLYRIDTEEEAEELRQDFREALNDTDFEGLAMQPQVWLTEREALEQIRSCFLDSYSLAQIDERLGRCAPP